MQLFAVLLMLLIGCTSAPQTLYGTLVSWQGKSVQLAVDAWGDPVSASKKDGVYVFVWVNTVTLNERLYYCEKTITTDKAGTIHAFSYAGHKEAGCF
jgi:hypothetical protein